MKFQPFVTDVSFNALPRLIRMYNKSISRIYIIFRYFHRITIDVTIDVSRVNLLSLEHSNEIKFGIQVDTGSRRINESSGEKIRKKIERKQALLHVNYEHLVSGLASSAEESYLQWSSSDS